LTLLTFTFTFTLTLTWTSTLTTTLTTILSFTLTFTLTVTDKTGNLGEVLQTMFLAYSESFLKHAQISKELIEAKAIAVEEVRLCT
jgi:hypothetical protein